MKLPAKLPFPQHIEFLRTQLVEPLVRCRNRRAADINAMQAKLLRGGFEARNECLPPFRIRHAAPLRAGQVDQRLGSWRDEDGVGKGPNRWAWKRAERRHSV